MILRTILPTDPWPTLRQCVDIGCDVLVAEEAGEPVAGFLIIPAEKTELHIVLRRPCGPEAFRLLRNHLRARRIKELWTWTPLDRMAALAMRFGFHARFLSRDGNLWLSATVT